MRGHLKYISQRLSLRKPQIEALDNLAKFLDKIGLPASNVNFESLKAMFPNLQDFEREFPNVCFSLATGVGKTRLMGAIISYLYLAKRVRNFLVFAPNNTILEKLIKDFSDPLHYKYVFKGISEFAIKKPKIITAENFEQGAGVRNEYAKQPDMLVDDDEIHINIFNIAKMHTGDRKIKQINDYLNESYFDYLSSLDDLVVLMDEAHRYRATAGMKTIQELKPMLGLELTATPQTENGSKDSVRFKNILYDYPLSKALKDGFLKEPAVAGRENFDPNNFADDEALDRFKIEDGIRIHEQTKMHLISYASETGIQAIKPLMLVVAQDTKHANHIQTLIEDDKFFDGNYKNKVLVVHSKVKAEAEEAMVRDLLEVESADNLIEIIIHVDMLREGWDIFNLFTMVPLRKANSLTLIEQNLGRGLRLPFGKRTGFSEIDTHTVVSHDRFNEIIDLANKDCSLIRRGINIGIDIPEEPMDLLEVDTIGKTKVEEIEDKEKREASLRAYEAINCFGLSDKAEIIKYIKKEPKNESTLDYEDIVNNVLKIHEENSINVPRVSVQPKVIESGRFIPFKLDLTHLKVKPFEEGIIIQGLSSGERKIYKAKESSDQTEGALDQLLMRVLDYNEIAEFEENNSVAEDCSKQMIEYLKGYLKDDESVSQVIRQQGMHISKIIHSQMMQYFKEPVIDWDIVVAENQISLRKNKLPMIRGSKIYNYINPVEDKLHIRQILFEGFKKSLYPIVKFDSDSERIFSVILEQDSKVEKWAKPSRSMFSSIYYNKDNSYVPDFIVETSDRKFLCEVKRASDMYSFEVIEKANSAMIWCDTANKHFKDSNFKPWTYLLIPHDSLNISMTFQGISSKYFYINKGE